MESKYWHLLKVFAGGQARARLYQNKYIWANIYWIVIGTVLVINEMNMDPVL